MGNDGGSIPTRRELVKEAARNPTTTELKALQTESQSHHWTHDPLTRAALATPVVSDSNGKLYNKSSILEFLLLPSSPTDADEGARKTESEKVTRGAVTCLKDVVDVKFEVEAEARDGRAEVWRCPVTAAVLGPGTKAVYLVPCGHAFSGAAIKEVAAGGNACLVCEAKYAPNDVIPILPLGDEEVARLSLRAKRLKESGLAHSLRKLAKDKTGRKDGGKKRKARGEEAAGADEVVPDLVTATKDADAGNAVKGAQGVSRAAPAVSATRAQRADGGHASNIRNSGTASLTAKVMAEQDKNKKRRMENENLKTLFSNRDPSKPHGRSSDFMTRGFDIPAGAKR